jgi:hypothetical protein
MIVSFTIDITSFVFFDGSAESAEKKKPGHRR